VADLHVRDVGKSFAGRAVLSDVDLHVADATTLSLLGPSGSGKSTLLRIIAGLERADAGSVRLGDRELTGVPPHRRGVGVVFQDQALFPHLDVAGNVGFGLRMAGADGPDRRRRVAEVLELVGLPGHEGRDPATLSGGEAQRVALARAGRVAPTPRRPATVARSPSLVRRLRAGLAASCPSPPGPVAPRRRPAPTTAGLVERPP